MFKRKAPILLGASLFAGLIVTVALLSSEPRDVDLFEPVRRHLLERKMALRPEDAHLTILSRSDREAFVNVEMAEGRRCLRLTNDAGWKVAVDLNDDFGAFLAGSGTLEKLHERLLQRIAGVLPADPEIREVAYTIDCKDRPVAVLAAIFRSGNADCRYEEAYSYKDGRWTREGQGQLFVPVSQGR